MKILIYAHLFPPSKGGLQYSNLEIVKGLFKLGHDIRLITCFNKGINEFISTFPFPVKVLPKWSFTPMASLSVKGLANWIISPWYFFLILREIKIFKPEVGFITDETANAFWGGITNRAKIPYISYCSVPFTKIKQIVPKYKFWVLIKIAVLRRIRKCLWNSYKGAKSILVVSNSTKSEIIEHAPEVAGKICVVPRSIDDKIFESPIDHEIVNKIKKSLMIKKDQTTLLSVARLTKRKGIDDVLKALARLDPQELKKIKYLVIGNGRDGEYLRELSESLKLDTTVSFLGKIDHIDLISYYDICDIFVLPSRRGISESFGRVFVEAAGRCKASIGVNAGGMKDIIDDGNTGWLIDAGDVEAVAKIIQFSIEHKERLKKMGLDARCKAEQKYTSLGNAKIFESYLRKAARTSKNR